MREYGQIQCAFWQSDDALKLGDAGKLLACYLLTGPHSNGIGCFRCPDGYVMADLGWSSERVSQGFAELSANGFAYRFDGVVFLPNFLRWNRVANGNVATARMAEFEALPKGEAKARVADAILKHINHLSDRHRTVLETVSGTVSETRQERYANQNPDPTLTNPTQKTGSPDGDPSPPSASPPAADDPGAGGGEGSGDDDGAPGVPPCPVTKIIEVYHAELPQLPRVRSFPDAARTALRTRWREDPERQDVEWWRGFFAYVARCPFLVGKAKTPFTASLDWLVKASNFAKVVNGNYHVDEAAA